MILLYHIGPIGITNVCLRADVSMRKRYVAFMTTGMEGIITRALAVHGIHTRRATRECTQMYMMGHTVLFALDITDRAT